MSRAHIFFSLATETPPPDASWGTDGKQNGASPNPSNVAAICLLPGGDGSAPEWFFPYHAQTAVFVEHATLYFQPLSDEEVARNNPPHFVWNDRSDVVRCSITDALVVFTQDEVFTLDEKGSGNTNGGLIVYAHAADMDKVSSRDVQQYVPPTDGPARLNKVLGTD